MATLARKKEGGGRQKGVFFVAIVVAIILLLFFLVSYRGDNTLQSYASSPLLQLEVPPLPALDDVSTKSKPKILVTFTGPGSTTLPTKPKVKLYRLNLHYFLKYGVMHDCEADITTVITIGQDFWDEYYPIVKAINEKRLSRCGASDTNRVLLVTRRNVCYDMESVRMVFHGAVAGIHIDDFDYFVYLNCGVTGPHPSHQSTWVQTYIEKLQNNIHMTGLSVMCEGGNTHVQSMMYALDRLGIDAIRHIPYDCLLTKEGSQNKANDYINSYERAMGRAILDHNNKIKNSKILIHRKGNEEEYAIAPATLQPHVGVITRSNRDDCKKLDMWITKHLEELYGGRLPTLEETIFWKTSRVLPPEIAELIGFNDTVNFNW